jgi:aspartyl-tRNA(Asn)/glutamyl-tRNA(Gln) amidotransferase subunit C
MTPMTLTLEEVEHIAALARLELDAEELERYRQQLSAILDYAARLRELDTSEILPTTRVLPQSSIPGSDDVPPALREDEPAPGLTTEDLLRSAPDSVHQQYRVPPIME